MYTRQEVYKFIEDHYRDNFDNLVKTNQNRMGGWHNTEDIIQEAYTRACQYWESLEHNGNFENWLNKIIKNCAIDKTREERSHGIIDSEEIISETVFTDNIINDLYIQEITDMINRNKNKDILFLYFINGLSTKEIDEIVPKSFNSIRKIVELFRKELRLKYGRKLYK